MYKIELVESSRPLNAKERISIKDTSLATSFDQATMDGAEIVIIPAMWAILAVHTDTKDYEKYIVVDQTGKKFVTGSTSFWSSFISIYDEMKEEPEDWAIRVYRIPSRNYPGKYFITCSVE